MPGYKTIPFLRATNGLNIVTDPVRIAFDPEKGVVDLATAYNVDIDSSGRISRRKGLTLIDSWNTHSIFCDGGVCLFVCGTALYRLNSDYTRTGIRSGLTLGARMCYVQVGNKVFYANGFEYGYVEGVTSYYWEASAYVGPITSRTFSSPPLGITQLEYYKGRIFCSKDDVLWFSEPFAWDWFDMASNYIQFRGNIRFLKAAYGSTDRDSDGIYVGTDYGVEFLEGDAPDKFSREQVSDSTPVYGTCVRAEAAKVAEGGTGKVVFWTAQNGIWMGKANGQAACVTKGRLKLPSALFGSAVYHDGKYLVLLEE
jgi:hypothetical protein